MKTSLYFTVSIALLTLPTMCSADKATTNSETRFYQALDHGDVNAVLETLHPAAQEQVDRPVLAAWIDAVGQRLGQHTSVKHTASSRTLSLTGTRIETTATVTFDRGAAEATITSLDGRIVDFTVQSDQMRDWFQGPTDVLTYDRTARRFITAFLTGDSESARTLMHPALLEAINNDDIETMVTKITKNGGKLEKLELGDQRFSLDGPAPALLLTYDVQCERAAGVCEIEFQFVGMKGFLLGFDFE